MVSSIPQLNTKSTRMGGGSYSCHDILGSTFVCAFEGDQEIVPHNIPVSLHSVSTNCQTNTPQSI